MKRFYWSHSGNDFIYALKNVLSENTTTDIPIFIVTDSDRDVLNIKQHLSDSVRNLKILTLDEFINRKHNNFISDLFKRVKILHILNNICTDQKKDIPTIFSVLESILWEINNNDLAIDSLISKIESEYNFQSLSSTSILLQFLKQWNEFLVSKNGVDFYKTSEFIIAQRKIDCELGNIILISAGVMANSSYGRDIIKIGAESGGSLLVFPSFEILQEIFSYKEWQRKYLFFTYAEIFIECNIKLQDIVFKGKEILRERGICTIARIILNDSLDLVNKDNDDCWKNILCDNWIEKSSTAITHVLKLNKSCDILCNNDLDRSFIVDRLCVSVNHQSFIDTNIFLFFMEKLCDIHDRSMKDGLLSIINTGLCDVLNIDRKGIVDYLCDSCPVINNYDHFLFVIGTQCSEHSESISNIARYFEKWLSIKRDQCYEFAYVKNALIDTLSLVFGVAHIDNTFFNDIVLNQIESVDSDFQIKIDDFVFVLRSVIYSYKDYFLNKELFQRNYGSFGRMYRQLTNTDESYLVIVNDLDSIFFKNTKKDKSFLDPEICKLIYGNSELQDIENLLLSSSKVIFIHDKSSNDLLGKLLVNLYKGIHEFEKYSTMFQYKRIIPVVQISANPPVTERPTQIAVTALQTYMNNPYEFYLKHILKVTRRNCDKSKFDRRKYGQVLHKISEYVVKNKHKSPPDRIFIENVISDTDIMLNDHEKIFYVDEIIKICKELIIHYHSLSLIKSLCEEKYLVSADKLINNSNISLTARIDRIDLLSDGSICLYDYKTSSNITKKSVIQLDEIQLLVSAIILQLDGIKQWNGEFSEIAYWNIIKNKKEPLLKGSELDNALVAMRNNLSVLLKEISDDPFVFRYNKKTYKSDCDIVCRLYINDY